MKEQFVIYEIALKLKELGFNEECLGVYYIKDNPVLIPATSIWWGHSKIVETVKAPLWQQAIDWLESEYQLSIDTRTVSNLKVFDYRIIELNKEYKNSFYDGIKPSSAFNSRYEAREQAILKAIELCKNN